MVKPTIIVGTEPPHHGIFFHGDGARFYVDGREVEAAEAAYAFVIDVGNVQRELASLRSEAAALAADVSRARHDGWIACRDGIVSKARALSKQTAAQGNPWAPTNEHDHEREGAARALNDFADEIEALEPDAEPARPPAVGDPAKGEG